MGTYHHHRARGAAFGAQKIRIRGQHLLKVVTWGGDWGVRGSMYVRAAIGPKRQVPGTAGPRLIGADRRVPS